MGRSKKINKKYKDTVFRLLFGKDKNELLKLYNAVNGSDYKNPDDLTINTLEDAIYVSMRNDVSFVFQDELSLYEHQSTLNPNLPLRDLFYVSDLLQEMTAEKNIYGTRRIMIPAPRFYVFYNGEDDPGQITEYRLSDMFEKNEATPELELIVKVININEGQNNKVLNNCKTLQEYAKFVAMIRENQKTMPIGKAITKAVNDCIEQGILKDFLLKHKAQVIKMSIYEYDEKKQRRFDREEGREEGGDIKLITLIQKKVIKGKTLDAIADELESTEEEIKPLYDIVLKYPTDTDPKELITHLSVNENRSQ